MARLLKISTANTAFQFLETLLRNRTRRHQAGQFVVQGVRAINAALAGGWAIKAFAFPRDRGLSRWATDILENSMAERHFEVVPQLFEVLAGKDDPSELIAVAAMRPDALDRIPVRPETLVVIADRPGSPGNLGTLIRSCDAFGVEGLVVTGHAVDLYDPATIRASVGAFFTVPSVVLRSHHEVAAWLIRLRDVDPTLRVVGTSARATEPLRGLDAGGSIALIVGNETTGMSHAYGELCDLTVSIPMRGTATSLNAAVAASIALYEIDANRRYDRCSVRS
jgi:TrmH family RNA methyltransferase